MTQKFEKLCHSAYGFSVGNMLHRQNEMPPMRMMAEISIILRRKSFFCS
jgi:hypothetical protein